MSDEKRLVERLRGLGGSLDIEAADALERLGRERDEDNKRYVFCANERDRLRAALEQYGMHAAGCPRRHTLEPCICGLSEALV